MLAGQRGPTLSRLLQMQVEVGEFFDAPDMVPVTSAHLMGDFDAMGVAGLEFIEGLVDSSLKCVVPTTNNPRSVDFGCWRQVGSGASVVEQEQRIVRALRQL